MLEWIEKTVRMIAGWRYYDEKELLRHILEGQHLMALDLTKLNASVARSVAASEALLAAHTDPAAQAAVDAAATTLDTESAKAEAAVAPAPAINPAA